MIVIRNFLAVPSAGVALVAGLGCGGVTAPPSPPADRPDVPPWAAESPDDRWEAIPDRAIERVRRASVEYDDADRLRLLIDAAERWPHRDRVDPRASAAVAALAVEGVRRRSFEPRLFPDDTEAVALSRRLPAEMNLLGLTDPQDWFVAMTPVDTRGRFRPDPAVPDPAAMLDRWMVDHRVLDAAGVRDVRAGTPGVLRYYPHVDFDGRHLARALAQGDARAAGFLDFLFHADLLAGAVTLRREVAGPGVAVDLRLLAEAEMARADAFAAVRVTWPRPPGRVARPGVPDSDAPAEPYPYDEAVVRSLTRLAERESWALHAYVIEVVDAPHAARWRTPGLLALLRSHDDPVTRRLLGR